MAVERIRRPYELLVRWRDGNVIGAHLQYENVIIVDGEVVKNEPDNDALDPLDVNTLATHPVLGQAMADALARAAVLEQENARLVGRVALADDYIAKARSAEAEKHLAGLKKEGD